MALIFRILVGLIGALSVLTALPHWFRVESLAATRGIEAIDAIGRANVRADVGGIFLAIGILALLAAWKQSRTWLVATLTLVLSALVGRFISLSIDGVAPGVIEPMAVESLVIAVFVGALLSWKDNPVSLSPNS